ncbi:replication-relaxation family protein [Microaerobacter geothermalis]|nr:replication-relaxation family protein [Microaerobacter geothermalis]
MKNLTKRDIDILYNLYRYRTLSIDQIKRLYFVEKPGYAYRKLYLMKKAGLVESKQMVALKNGKGGCYFITEKGIDILEEHKLTDKRRRARDNKVENNSLAHFIEINDLLIELSNYLWSFIPSREVKEKRGMNRSALVKGALVDQDNKEYVLYLLENDSKEETIERIVNEIRTHSFSDCLILCKGQESYKKLKPAIKTVAVAGTLNILPYHFALRTLKQINGETSFVKIFTKYGEVTPIDSVNGFAKYIVDHHGKKKYIANYLFGDQMMLYFLELYTYDKYLMDGKEVLLFAWGGQVEELDNMFSQYPHIEIVVQRHGQVIF